MNTIGAFASGATTKFARGKNPFTGERAGVIDPNKLELTDDPPPVVRATKDGKYTELFKKAVATGKRIKCEGPEAAKLSADLKKFMKDRGIKGSVRSTKDYTDGKGGVWYIKPKADKN